MDVGRRGIIIAILRLASITKHSLGFLQPIIDITFYTPMPIIWSCIEANIALITASIPIFWPVVLSDLSLTFGKIMVSTEVEVRSDVRSARHSFYNRRNNYRRSGVGSRGHDGGNNGRGGQEVEDGERSFALFSQQLAAGLAGVGKGGNARVYLESSRSDDDEQELTRNLGWRGAYGKTEISRSAL